MDGANSKNSKVMKIVEDEETTNLHDGRQTRKRMPKNYRDWIVMGRRKWDNTLLALVVIQKALCVTINPIFRLALASWH